MRLGLYTVPHTGTRFVSTFLREIGGIDFVQRHVAAERTRPEWRHILTVRDPRKCYLTHRRRYPSNTDVNFVAMWGHYIWRTQWQDAFYFSLDVPSENRLMQLQQLLGWCKGGLGPKDQPIIERWAEEWPKVGSTKEGDETFPRHMEKPLEFAVEWYKHYSVFWGPYVRNSCNTLGEGA